MLQMLLRFADEIAVERTTVEYDRTEEMFTISLEHQGRKGAVRVPRGIVLKSWGVFLDMEVQKTLMSQMGYRIDDHGVGLPDKVQFDKVHRDNT